MEVYITTYALTKGIFKSEILDQYSTVIKVENFINGCRLFHNTECHKTFEEAKTSAEEMRLAEMVKLKKQYNKLKELKFEEPE